MKTQKEIREELQDRVLKLSRKHKNLVLNWATGSGKSYASLKIIDDIVKNNEDSFGYLICKESNHKKNWIREIKTHNLSHLEDKLSISLYGSISKLGKNPDFIILDECHAITPKRSEELKKIIGPNTKIILLSATIPYEKKILIEVLLKRNVVYDEVTLVDAINMGLLPIPKVFIHNIELVDDNNRVYSFSMNKGNYSSLKEVVVDYKDRWSKYNSSKNLKMTCLCNEKEYYEYLTSQILYFQEIHEDFSLEYIKRITAKNKFLNLSSARKKFIASVKTKKAKEIISSFGRKRYICFSGTIKQSLELGGSSSVNSDNHKKVNESLIEGFNDKSYSKLHAVSMLREGMNLVEVEKGLIVQLDSTIGSWLQMLGRLLRHEFPEVHLIRLRNTQDEKYFNRAMVDFNEKFVTEI